MDAQSLIDVLIGVVIAGLGWWINNMWSMLKSLQEQISGLNVKLSEHYVPRAELQSTFNRIFEKLDEITKEIAHISRNQAHAKALQELLNKEKP